MTKLSIQEKIKKLTENYREHLNSITLSYANEFHKLAREYEKESEEKQ
jgi:hypothetical protein